MKWEECILIGLFCFVQLNLAAQSSISFFSDNQKILTGFDKSVILPRWFESQDNHYDFDFLDSPYVLQSLVSKDEDVISIKRGEYEKETFLNTKAGLFYKSETKLFDNSKSGLVSILYEGERPYVIKDKRLSSIRKTYHRAFQIDDPVGELKEILPPSTKAIKVEVATDFQVKSVEEGVLVGGAHNRNVTVWYYSHRVKSKLLYYKSDTKWILMDENVSNSIFQKSFDFLHGDFEEFQMIDNQTKIPLVTSTLVGDKYRDTRYRILENDPSNFVISPLEKDVVLYPNPTYGDISIDLVNYPLDRYSFRIYNIIGKEIYRSKEKQTLVLKDDVSFLSKGSYLFSVFNGSGNKLKTKKLVIITP